MTKTKNPAPLAFFFFWVTMDTHIQAKRCIYPLSLEIALGGLGVLRDLPCQRRKLKIKREFSKYAMIF